MNNQFSENLKKIRKEHNLSQEQLAEELGVSRQAISKWESSQAYPEMDKIIMLCEKFNVNIDDLLHNDIKEVKGEEESKNKINNVIKDSLNFISDSLELFSRMKFMNKIYLLVEEIALIVLFFMISLVVVTVGTHLLSGLFIIFPADVEYILSELLQSALIIFCIIASSTIIIHIFKVRYLDYFNKAKNESEIEEEGKKSNLKRHENKIIIRNEPKKEYKLVYWLFKIVVFIFKVLLGWVAVFGCIGLVILFAGLVCSFMLYKTGFFFTGLICTIVAGGVFGVTLLSVILNFMLDRKNNKKKLIYIFIISIIVIGLGCGQMLLGSLDFETVQEYEPILIHETKTYDMKDYLVIHPNAYIEYIEKDIDNVEVEYIYNKACNRDEFVSKSSVELVDSYVGCNNDFKLMKQYIDALNDKKVLEISANHMDAKVYASKENLEKLKNNYKSFTDVINNANKKKES